ncbi:MAG: ABC transporter ATP-binding protein [Acidobacteriota bacterium]
MSAYLELRGLHKSFGETRVLEDLSLEIGDGEILALLGLSGSGKTTALRLLAGFEKPDAGEIKLEDRDITALGPVERGFGMVFQHYALFPHLSVGQNVAFGLEARKWAKAKIEARVEEMLELVDLSGYGDRKVSAISGGQQQRVALARALAPEPTLLLLDEPLSNLDPALREKTRSELRSAVKRIGITTVLVTHEQEEAFHVGDRVAVLNRGHLEQVGAATELYRNPKTPFVAGFIGRSTTLRGTAEGPAAPEGEVWVRLGASASLDQPSVSWEARAAAPAEAGAEVDLVVRPESLVLTEAGRPGGLEGRFLGVRFTGALSYARVELVAFPDRVAEVLLDGDTPASGQRVWVAPRGGGPVPRVFTPEPV